MLQRVNAMVTLKGEDTHDVQFTLTTVKAWLDFECMKCMALSHGREHLLTICSEGDDV